MTSIAFRQMNWWSFGKALSPGTTHVYGYNFGLVAAFQPALELYFSKSEVWCWFPAQCLATTAPETSPNELLRLGSLTSHATPTTPTTVTVKRKLSFDDSAALGGTASSIESSESLKRPKPVPVEEDASREEEEDQEIEPEEQQIEPEPELEVTKRPPGTWICCLLSQQEWEYVSQGKCKHILRPWGTAKQDLCVLVEKPHGISLCGVLSVDKAKRACEDSFEAATPMYSRKQMKVIQKQKSCFAWEILKVQAFDDEIVTSCLEIPQRMRNRPFPVPIDELKARHLDYPTSLSLKETGKFFLSCMKPDMIGALKHTVGALCCGKATVRIGTTCSGADICVRVVQQTFAILQEHFGKQGITVEHTFSCEKDPRKRGILLQGHAPKHCFGDTDDFREGRGFCYVTNQYVPINRKTCGIDILLSGPVCKDISLLNRKRKMSAGCYEKGFEAEGQDGGVSGQTYENGFRKAWQELLHHLHYLYI